MKSNRMRIGRPAGRIAKDLASAYLVASGGVSLGVDLTQMAPPAPVTHLHPDQIIEDILLATLSRVQASANPELAAAAARYMTLLREKAV
jgi:hypothetical protein